MKVLFGGYHKTANISRDPKRDGIISPMEQKGAWEIAPYFNFYGNSKIWQAPFCLFEETTVLYVANISPVLDICNFLRVYKKPFEIANVPFDDDIKYFP